MESSALGHWASFASRRACSVLCGRNADECGCSRRVYAHGVYAIGNESRQCVQAVSPCGARSPGTPTPPVRIQRRPKRVERLHALAYLDTSLKIDHSSPLPLSVGTRTARAH